MKNFASPEKLFYKLKSGYFAYVPKGCDAEGKTLQSRNSLIGQFTEKWCKKLFEPIAKDLKLHAINGVICEEIGLSRQSNADIAFCTTNDTMQKPQNIKIIFEIKMSVVSNYKFYKFLQPDTIEFVVISSFGISSISASFIILSTIKKLIIYSTTLSFNCCYN